MQAVESAPRPAAPAQEGKTENRLYTNEKLWVSNAYPNPADDVAELDYQFVALARLNWCC